MITNTKVFTFSEVAVALSASSFSRFTWNLSEIYFHIIAAPWVITVVEIRRKYIFIRCSDNFYVSNIWILAYIMQSIPFYCVSSYASAVLGSRNSVRLSVRHTAALWQN